MGIDPPVEYLEKNKFPEGRHKACDTDQGKNEYTDQLQNALVKYRFARPRARASRQLSPAVALPPLTNDPFNALISALLPVLEEFFPFATN